MGNYSPPLTENTLKAKKGPIIAYLAKKSHLMPLKYHRQMELNTESSDKSLNNVICF
jgi:hypothetical protein